MTASGPMILLALAVVFAEGAEVTFVRCPNGALCPDRSTCCLQSSGQYGCCPYQFAVCCSDHVHCCPEGYRCNMSNGTCLQISTITKKVETLLTPMVLSPQPGAIAPAVERVRCPDGNYCQDGQTCCLTTGGRFGCCPYPHAECCSDHASCCPELYRCQLSTHSCMLGNSTVPMLKKISTFSDSPAPVERVRCPDGNYCQDGQTCCLTTGGRFGCCPYPHAECCSDHASCCPEGYRCQLSTHSCTLGNSTVAMLKKVSTFSDSAAPVSDEQCPDGGSCADSQTCCQMPDGSYGCCPYEGATCCSDDVHCCPSGFECDTATMSCRKGHTFAAASRKIPARRTLSPVVNDVTPTDQRCPDGAQCDDDQTCCELSDHSYGCCPYNHAVCCPDLVHCCPEGYTCDTTQMTCVQNGNRSTIPLKRLSPRSSLDLVEVKVRDTTCKDGHICPGDTTCCPTPSGRYNCCPFASGVCCSDGEHCCPQGFQCDLSTERCIRGALYPFLEEVPMHPKLRSASSLH